MVGKSQVAALTDSCGPAWEDGDAWKTPAELLLVLKSEAWKLLLARQRKVIFKISLLRTLNPPPGSPGAAAVPGQWGVGAAAGP